MYSQPLATSLLGSNLCAVAGAATLRIRVGGPDPLLRAGVINILRSFDDLVVTEVGPADVVVLVGGDYRADAPVVALVDDAAAANQALGHGAHAVLLRGATPKRLHAALVAVADGLYVVDDELSDAVINHRGEAELLDPLTARETEVVQLLASGLTNKEIANRLGISDHTVKFHVNGIMGKLGVETRTEAVVHAARLGIVAI